MRLWHSQAKLRQRLGTDKSAPRAWQGSPLRRRIRWADACRPHFRRAGAARSAPAQETACARAEAQACRAWARRSPWSRTWPDLAGGDAAPPGPGGSLLHRPGGLSGLRPLSGVERRRRRQRVRDGARLCRRRRRSGRPGRVRARRHRADPEALPALAQVGRGGSDGDRCRAPARARRPDGRTRPRGRSQGAVRPQLLPAPRRGHRRGPLLGHQHALRPDRRTHHRHRPPRLWDSHAHRPLGLGHGPRRPPRRGARQARHCRLRDGGQGEPDQHRPGPDRYDPGRHRARLRAARADRGRGGHPCARRRRGRDCEGRELRRRGAHRRRAGHERTRGPRGSRRGNDQGCQARRARAAARRRRSRGCKPSPRSSPPWARSAAA